MSSPRFDQVPFHQQMIPKGDERITPYLSDTLVRGDPDLVYRARDWRDVSAILQYCHRARIPVTFCGSQTSLTGASVAMGGILIAMEQKNRLLDIHTDPQTGHPTATAEPGMLLGEFQRQVAAQGWFYPPDPTSKEDAQLGGTIGTNATGEDSLRYGPTRKYVRRLKLLLADGSERIVERKKPYQGPTKNLAGYYLQGELIDQIVGSEGTLGLITEVTVDLLPASPSFFLAWAFFPDLAAALEFVVRARQDPNLTPRSLELIDRESLRIVARQDRAPAAAATADCAITFKQEYCSEAEEKMNHWLSLLESILKPRRAESLLNEIVVAMEEPAQQQLRSFRHAIPSGVNEEAEKYRAEGGGKVSTDWWVPLPKLQEMMAEVIRESDLLGIRYLAYAHIGDGHPHLNYVAKNRGEKAKVLELLEHQCRRAVALGGGVAGEHGLGKLHRDFLSLQCSQTEIAAMLQLKHQFDPHDILGKGNIFK